MHVPAKLLGRLHPRNATSMPSVRLSSSFFVQPHVLPPQEQNKQDAPIVSEPILRAEWRRKCLHCSVIYFFIGPGRNGSMSGSSQQIPDQDHGIARSRSASTTPFLNPCSISVSVNYLSFSPPRPRWRVNSSMSGCHSYLLIPFPHKPTLFSL